MEKYSLRFFFIIFSFVFANFVFSQSADQGPVENQDTIIDVESEKSDDKNIIDSLQRNFTIITAQQPWNLDIHTATYSSEAQILDSLYEGLFSYDPKTLEPLPALAESYKISRDKKRWTFTLRENLEFSNGEKINAYTVKNSWLSLLRTHNAPYASMLDCIKGAAEYREGKISDSEVGINARNEKTLVVSLINPTAHFSKLLCHHAFAVCSLNQNGSTDTSVFSGAFTIKENTGSSLVLEKNEKYWDAKNVHLPQITIKQSNEVKENSWSYNDGSADWLSGMVDTNALLNKNSIRISAIFGTEFLFFSCKNKPWNDADFRNALITAVPWEELRKTGLVKASTLIYPLAGYQGVNGITETSGEDALEMMEEARKKLGVSKDEKLTVTFGISSISERQKSQAEILKKAWEPLGVELKIQTTPDDRYIDSIPGWNADIFSYSWIGDFADPIAFLELFRANSTLNPSKWQNEKFEELIQKANESTDNGEHYKYLAQAEQLLLDEGEVMPITHSISLHAVNLQQVGGWYVNALDIHPFKYLYFKEVKVESAPNII
ncbi:peptide ABC transporter substrate-binding protein [Treponema ruminis]|uniref:Oligopeptide transport system substrate-binding protein n=1 Tax=Treponema ruminis TaxID=744515 RepID=A0A7W8LKR3_9SPIR|nr:peptide ABC transporter substrate-binding protein [Treponema ruminis]MBB5224747.1 oligopeptide transport system substrate-binding protein [Treponema ruminis]